MANEVLQSIVGTALVDSAFRQNLLNKSPEALGRFDLTAEESVAITSVRARTFHGFANELQRWISSRDAAPIGRARF
jgi:hypothetical protein